jgi:hypothetical protein
MTTTTYRTEEIRGSLVNDQGISSDVMLDLEIAQLHGDQGIDDEAVAHVSITFGVRIPADGFFTLHYVFDNRPYQEQVQIKAQRMIGGICRQT